MHRYTAKDVTGLVKTCVDSGVFPKDAELNITTFDGGPTHFSVENHSGSHIYEEFEAADGARGAWYRLRALLRGFQRAFEYADEVGFVQGHRDALGVPPPPDSNHIRFTNSAPTTLASDLTIADEKLATMARADSVTCLKVLIGICRGHLQAGRNANALYYWERTNEIATELNVFLR